MAGVEYILSARAVRERSGLLREIAQQAGLENFILHEEKLDGLVERVRGEILLNYPKLDVPYHSRWRHFSVGGIDREAVLDEALAGLSLRERCRAKLELAIVSVLLDAGAGSEWCFVETPGGARYGRSEGLAVASLRAFVSGLFGDAPCSVSSERLLTLSPSALEEAFQVSASNPLVGVAGRVALLSQLGRIIGDQPEYFRGMPNRLGGMLEVVEDLAVDGGVKAGSLLSFILRAFGAIWPGRIAVQGVHLGDVWRHSKLHGDGELDRLVPFHKLSQWLTYSLLEPLQEAGIPVTHVNELTGLAEYRNGGLFIDSGVLELKDAASATQVHAPSSELVVEWRALTVSLLDSVADALRARMGLSEEQFPLAKVLQGGTWSLGRKMAAERRAHAAPPIQILSDGTVF